MKTKRLYQKPAVRVVELRQQCRILAGSETGNGGGMPGGVPAEPF